eukprot:CAMPEP_0197614186 /NCGR_PEP_ID=MMETSP1326-20131121/59398_1 /TAXON_ID=1155430 /ORGANISM="Genus nov. species nov., Strain RCC2288" /LENGTH=397 /DNA_ID=CAMNT_0043183055 /DNA_START=195 /DNA_END=1384 /DNA_ORIENTATION=-
MGGNGHAYIGYDGADEQFYVEQTKRELSNQAFRKKALEDGVDLFAEHETAVITAGDCLYGVSRGANDAEEAKASAATAAAREISSAGSSKKPTAAAQGLYLKSYKNNHFDRHKTMITLQNRALQQKKAEEKAKKETPFQHSAAATVLRQTILAGNTGALPKAFAKGAMVTTDPAMLTKPKDIDAGGRPVAPGAYDFDPDSIDAEMAALVDTAVSDAKASKAVAAAAGVVKKKRAAAAAAVVAKPAWALAAAAAEAAAEEEEAEAEVPWASGAAGGPSPERRPWAALGAEAAAEEEELELLAFADGLDFDTFVETIDEEDLVLAKQALDDLVAAAAMEGGDFDDDESENPKVNQSAEHLAKIEGWKRQFLDAINRVRDVEGKVAARKSAIKAARATVA